MNDKNENKNENKNVNKMLGDAISNKVSDKKNVIVKMLDDEGIDISNQALGILLKLEDYKFEVSKLIVLVKKRKFIITGSDVVRFVINNDVPNFIGGD